MAFMIFTDSGCDISREILTKWGIGMVSLRFRFENEPEQNTSELTSEEFYRKMREGKISRTSASNLADFLTAFEPVLNAGKDILYLGFSSGLSNTVNAGAMAAKELRLKYPGREIAVVDSLCASAGLGLLCYLTALEQKKGKSLRETAEFSRKLAPEICHWFTVEDLAYLKRGGRISGATAFLGGVLNIRPVMHMNDEGKLMNVRKARGRKQAILALRDQYAALARDPEHGVYFISHGDCPEDAAFLESAIEKRYGHSAGLITAIGPVIGSHSGPDTLALFFIGKKR